MAPTSPKIGDFHILPISTPPLPSFPHAVTHHIYLRPDEPKVPTPDDSRTLFLTNLPTDSTELHLRAIFAELVGAGRFESITFEDDRRTARSVSDAQPAQAARLAALNKSKKRKRGEQDLEERAREEEAARLPDTWPRKLHRSGGTATVLLADEKSAEQVLKAVTKLHKKGKFPVWGALVPEDRIPKLGAPWLRAHNRMSYPSSAAVASSVDAFFELFNKREKEAAELAKRMRNEPDEDGFVTVVRGGSTRSNPAAQAEAEEAKRKMLEKQEKKKEEWSNFYRFQVREKRKAEQEELVKRFDEDRKKVQMMREKKGKFIPEA